MTKIDEKFVAAVKRMEARTSRVSAYVVIPNVGSARVTCYGRIVISYPADGAGRLYAIAWLPGALGDQSTMFRHHGHATGYGYDKASAAMSGATYFDIVAGETRKLADQGYDFRRKLETVGYTVIRAV